MPFIVNKQFHEVGLALRKSILGDERVRRALASEDDLIEFHHLLGHECAYAQIWTRSEFLPADTRSLVVVAMLATLTPNGESLKVHVRGAVRNGASRAAIRQVLATISFYLGAGIGTEAIITAREELGSADASEENAAQRNSSVTPEPLSREELHQRGLQVRQALFGPDTAALASGKDGQATYESMKTEYYFGVLWSEPDLPMKVRVMVVIAILCAGNRMDQLRIYLRAARRIGCSHSEIKEVFLTACIYCGAPACEDGLAAAQEIFSSEPE